MLQLQPTHESGVCIHSVLEHTVWIPEQEISYSSAQRVAHAAVEDCSDLGGCVIGSILN